MDAVSVMDSLNRQRGGRYPNGQGGKGWPNGRPRPYCPNCGRLEDVGLNLEQRYPRYPNGQGGKGWPNGRPRPYCPNCVSWDPYGLDYWGLYLEQRRPRFWVY